MADPIGRLNTTTHAVTNATHRYISRLQKRSKVIRVSIRITGAQHVLLENRIARGTCNGVLERLYRSTA